TDMRACEQFGQPLGRDWLFEAYVLFEVQPPDQPFCLVEIVTAPDYDQAQPGNAMAGNGHGFDRDIEAQTMRDRSVADQIEVALIAVPMLGETKRRRIGNIHYDAKLLGRQSGFDQPAPMKFVHRQHQVCATRAQPLPYHQQARSERAATAAELVAIQLRHGVVDIEQDARASQPGWD